MRTAIRRAETSSAPPAACGTIRRMARLGYSAVVCANAVAQLRA